MVSAEHAALAPLMASAGAVVLRGSLAKKQIRMLELVLYNIVI